ncbi:Glycine cleavage system H protein [Escovopsis weberi]|uniref:Glycine cleavage system H protein n=1 Tax=Escovopsis weberi TaxID=150374 RepID=A0A0M8N025_ESCWE|nr:Glycine cleavage system H protein [Escovopsis weberi]
MASIAASLRAVRPALARLAPRAAARPIPSRACFSTTRATLLRKYTESHEWIDLSADGKSGCIGITDFAAKQLGDIVFVELPETGAALAAGESLGAIESVKSASDVLAPIACTVVQANAAVEEEPKRVNQLPEDDSAGGGWIARVEVSEEGLKEFESLMTAEEYKASVEEH